MSSQKTDQFKVVLNDEEQYSIWPSDKENALGWYDAGKQGSKEECLEYIKRVWTDMRPKTLPSVQRKDRNPVRGSPLSCCQGVTRNIDATLFAFKHSGILLS